MHLLFALLLAVGPAFAGASEAELAAMKPVISAEYPSVPWIDRRALVQALATDALPPMLLDARTQAEWDAGHLALAKHLPHTTTDLSAVSEDRAQPIVVYCAVGYRSAALADRLLQAGYTHVHNLEGGIFGWANAGLPMVRDGQATTTAHPFDAVWGRMLSAEHRADPGPAQ
jgi:rhodanese-related sulfurtransferase